MANTKNTNGTAKEAEIAEWRSSVTAILAQQTEILAALREDFRNHEAQEERYQEKVSEFMSVSKLDRAVIVEKAITNTDKILSLEEHHKSAMDIMQKINQKVWLAVGAIMIYAPILTFLAVELYNHLIKFPGQ